MNYLKLFIQEKLFRTNGINGEYLKYEWFVKSGFEKEWKEVLDCVSFLNKTKIDKEVIWCILNDVTTVPKCEFCGNQKKFRTNGYICTRECYLKHRQSVKVEKAKGTNIKKYGVDNPSKSEYIKNKIKQSHFEKFGSWNTQTSEFKITSSNTKQNLYNDYKYVNADKMKFTKIKKYGIPTYNNSEKTKNTLIEKYGMHHMKLPEYKERHKRNLYENIKKYSESIGFIALGYDQNFYEIKYQCVKCGNEVTRISPNGLRCLICYPFRKTKAEIELKNYIESLGVSVTCNSKKIISNLELDIYIPSKQLAIEYDGLLWHSYGKSHHSFLNNYNIEDKSYHLNKTNLCKEKGITLLHIFENEWKDKCKQEIWKSIISSKIGKNNTIYARKCILKEVSKPEAYTFLDENHLQGKCVSGINLGLFFEDELVALLCVGKSRYNKKYEWEILRYCNKKFVNVVGGFSRLLKKFRFVVNGSIITYADMRYSAGDLYKLSGFVQLKDSPPNYFYWKPSKNLNLYSRIKFQKHKLKTILKFFNPDKTEVENMFDNGWRRIWDCGNKVFVL